MSERKYDTLDFTVTIHVPQSAVTLGGESVVLKLERKLLAKSMAGKVASTLLQGLGADVPLGTKIEVHSVDIVWDDPDADDECEVCDGLPCVCKVLVDDDSAYCHAHLGPGVRCPMYGDVGGFGDRSVGS